MDSQQGARLKKIRLEKGLSLEEAHKKTRIELSTLKAIEDDSLINFSPVYIKGFLKIYCQYLGVDPQDYIPDYKEAPPVPAYLPGEDKEAAAPLFPATSQKRAYFKGLSVKAVVIPLLLLLFFIGLFHMGKIFSSKRVHVAKKEKTASVPGKKEKKEKSVKSPKAVVALPAPKEAAGPEVSSPANATLGIRLGLHAREDCYVPYLKIDGKVIFQGVIKKGRSESWQAKEKIEFALSNAGVVDVEVNGKRILPLGRRGQAVKNIVVDKEGLKTKR
jgi:transcriptional regulator with XRE-family HTH domain